uniref:DUF4476 domain-containing protein n=1 Tax=Heterorhabditis bacteriophora TaxID=37862 RepID=A0A1I7X2C5_HETBA
MMNSMRSSQCEKAMSTTEKANTLSTYSQLKRRNLAIMDKIDNKYNVGMLTEERICELRTELLTRMSVRSLRMVMNISEDKPIKESLESCAMQEACYQAGMTDAYKVRDALLTLDLRRFCDVFVNYQVFFKEPKLPSLPQNIDINIDNSESKIAITQDIGFGVEDILATSSVPAFHQLLSVDLTRTSTASSNPISKMLRPPLRSIVPAGIYQSLPTFYVQPECSSEPQVSINLFFIFYGDLFYVQGDDGASRSPNFQLSQFVQSFDVNQSEVDPEIMKNEIILIEQTEESAQLLDFNNNAMRSDNTIAKKSSHDILNDRNEDLTLVKVHYIC